MSKTVAAEGAVSTRAVPSLKKNVSWTFLGNTFYTGCQWLMMVILAKYVSPEVVGQFGLGLSITAPLIMCTNLQLRPVQATDADNKFLFREYFGLRIVSSFVALLLLCSAYFFSPYSEETTFVIFLVGISKAIESLSDIFIGLFQSEQQMHLMARSLITKGILSIGALWCGLAYSHSLSLALIVLSIAWFVNFWTFDVRRGMQLLAVPQRLRKGDALFPSFTFSRMRELAVLTLPLGLSMAFTSLNVNIPRYFIQEYFGEREVGYFSPLAYTIMAGITIMSAVGTSASPRLARSIIEKKFLDARRLFERLLLVAGVLGIGGVLVVAVAGPWLLSVLFRPDYAAYNSVLLWLMIGNAINFFGMVFGTAATVLRLFRLQLCSTIAVTCITLIASQLLVPSLKGDGAAIVLGIGNAVNFFILALGVTRRYLLLRREHKTS